MRLEVPPEAVQATIRKAVTLLSELSRIATNDAGQKKSKKRTPENPRLGIRSQFPRPKDKHISDKVIELENESIFALSRLRHLCPATVLRVIDFERHNTQNEQFTFALGRALGQLDQAGRQAIWSQTLDEFLCAVSQGPDQDLPALKRFLWVFVTNFWTCETAVLCLNEEQIQTLAQAVQKVARHLKDNWLEEGIAVELFNELALLSLALLRHRPAYELVHAGSTFSTSLASDFESIHKSLKESGRNRNPRVKLNSETATFGELIPEILRGYQSTLVQLVD